MEKVGGRKLDYVASSPESLPQIAEALVNFCDARRIICFFGEMGAGKTTFIRALCAQLDVRENVSSPTFSLVNEYHSIKGEPLFHFDFYRINRPEEAISMGVDEYFVSGNWCFVEWPEKILHLLPDNRVDVRIESIDNSRQITFFYV
jgi:tRNA threonylcarbamoyladenosine biosynthesis protein TsaE